MVELPSTKVYEVLPIPVEEASNLQAALLAQKALPRHRPVCVLDRGPLRRDGI